MQKNLNKEPKEYQELEHTTINFIDDSNSVLSFGKAEEAVEYLKTYFEVLKIYYHDMKLKLNPEKTTLMVVSRPNQQHMKEKIMIKEGEETIKPDPQVKILGWYSNERLDQETNINTTIGIINTILHKLKPVEKDLSTETRKKNMQSIRDKSLTHALTH